MSYFAVLYLSHRNAVLVWLQHRFVLLCCCYTLHCDTEHTRYMLENWYCYKAAGEQRVVSSGDSETLLLCKYKKKKDTLRREVLIE